MNAVQLAEDVVSFAKKPSLMGVAKIGSNFLPGSSGVRKGYKAVKLAKALAKGAKKVISSAKNTRIAKKISQTIKKKNTKATCFVAGTLISTENGYINIEDIKVSDRVYSKNEQTGEKGLKKVVNTFIHDKDEIVELKVDGEVIKTTKEHPFYVEGKGFVEVKDLIEGDILVDYYGKTQKLESKRVVNLDKPIKVYNFEVEDWHTYFVTKEEIFVHNKAKQAGILQKVSVPKKVSDVLKKIEANNGLAPKGYNKTKTFYNNEKRLPTNTTYKEYDVNPLVKGKNRGTERIVIGKNGLVYYTKDHYKTFIRIK